MKKNPLVLLLGISAFFFIVFSIFIFFVTGQSVKDKNILAMGKVDVGLIKINGVIMDSQRTLKELKELEEDSSVKAIILRINSPGGAVGPSQEIHDAVIRVRKTKPVVASFESVAASGGYYIAVAAEKIVSNPGTLTGSIGVIMDFANLSELYKWAKVDRYNLKSGKFKDSGSETRAMTSEERELMQGLIDNVYHQFLNAVAKGRNLPVEKIKPYADGRVLSGEQALAIGLVDRLGGLDIAVDTVKELAKIKESEKVNIVYPEAQKKTLLEFIGQGAAEGIAEGFLKSLQEKAPALLQPKQSGSLYFF